MQSFKGQLIGTKRDGDVERVLVDADGKLITQPSGGGRSTRFTIFGGQVSHSIRPQLEANFTYRIDSSVIKNLSTSTGSIGFELNQMYVSTGESSAAIGEVSSKQTITYSPARDAIGFFTARYTEPTAQSRQFIGLCNGENGFAIGFEEEDWVVSRKFDSNRFITDFNSFSECEVEKIDNANYKITWPDGFEFIYHPKNMNVFAIQYGYLGAAPIYFEIYTTAKEGFRTLHIIEVANKQEETHVANPYLPLMGKVENFGNTTDMRIYSGSVMAGTIGGSEYSEIHPSSREFTVRTGEVAITAGDDIPLLIFHNKESMYGMTNKIADLLLSVDGATDLNKPASFSMYALNTVPTGLTLIDVDLENSNLQYSKTGTIDLTGARLLFNKEVGKSTDFSKTVSSKGLMLYPGDYAVLTVSTEGSGVVRASIDESERY